MAPTEDEERARKNTVGSNDPHGETSIHVRAAIAGDQQSLSWLIARLSPWLLAHAAWRLGTRLRRHYDPEDVVADAWARILPHLNELQARDGRHTPVVLRFLSTAITNRISNLVKKHLRPGRDAETPDRDAFASLSQVPAEVSGVITAAVNHESKAVVLAALDALDPIDREILFLRGLEQRSYEVIAVLLGITPSAAMMRSSRARKRLREQLPASAIAEFEGD